MHSEPNHTIMRNEDAARRLTKTRNNMLEFKILCLLTCYKDLYRIELRASSSVLKYYPLTLCIFFIFQMLCAFVQGPLS